jgi:hypothetical protein
MRTLQQLFPNDAADRQRRDQRSRMGGNIELTYSSWRELVVTSSGSSTSFAIASFAVFVSLALAAQYTRSPDGGSIICLSYF